MYSSLRQYRPNSYPVPWGYPSGPLTIEAAPITLGAFDPSALLSSVTAPDASLSINTTLLYGGLALLGVAMVWHYVGKGKRKYRSYSRKRTQKALRRQQLKAELASL